MSANATCIAFMLAALNSRWKQVVAVPSDVCLAVGSKDVTALLRCRSYT